MAARSKTGCGTPGSLRGDPCRLAGGAADLGPHLGHRLGGRRHRRRRRGRDRARLSRRRGRHHSRFGGPDRGPRAAGLRPHVPDALLGPHPQRDRKPDHRGRQHHGSGPGQLDHHRPAAPTSARWPARTWPDPHWTLHAAAQLGYTAQPWPVQYLTGKQQLERNLERQRQARDAGHQHDRKPIELNRSGDRGDQEALNNRIPWPTSNPATSAGLSRTVSPPLPSTGRNARIR